MTSRLRRLARRAARHYNQYQEPLFEDGAILKEQKADIKKNKSVSKKKKKGWFGKEK